MPATDVELGYRESREITRREAKNFYYAFLTLPQERRRAIYVAYAFCRYCDDAVAVIERELEGREYMLETGFSIADIVLGEMLTFAAVVELGGELPNAAAYVERLKARPAHERASAQ